MATQSVATISVRPWVITTPFGTPVVPEVKRMSDGSSGPSAALRRSTSARGRGAAPARKSRHDCACPVGLALGDDDRLERRQRGAGVLEHGDVVRAEEVGDGDEDAGPAAGEDHGGLGALEAGVDGHQDGAGGEDAEGSHRPFGAVAAPDRHPVARFDSGRDQCGAELPGRLGQLGIRKAWSPRRARPPGRQTASAAPPTMAGMEGQGEHGRRRAHRRTGAGPRPVL